jgi:hypothetical protein
VQQWNVTRKSIEEDDEEEFSAFEDSFNEQIIRRLHVDAKYLLSV